MHQVPARPARPSARNASGELGDGEAGDGLEERPQVGEERELAHEEQEDRRHAERDLRLAKQPRGLVRRMPAGRQRRHGDPLPDEREQCERNDSAKAPRQPMMPPSQAPSGAEIVAAMALPAFSIASPCGTCSCGRSRMTIAVDIDQNPPMAMPSSARPIISTRIGRRERDDQRRDDQEHREGRTARRLRSMPRVSPGDGEAGDHGEEAGDRDRLTGLSLADAEIARDRGQQADGHEFRRDEDGDAERHRA